MANGCRCFFASLANTSPSTRDTADSQLTRRITSTADSEVRNDTDISPCGGALVLTDDGESMEGASALSAVPRICYRTLASELGTGPNRP